MCKHIALVLIVVSSVVIPITATAQDVGLLRSRATIRDEIRLLRAEDRALPEPDRGIELALAITSMVAGVGVLAADLGYAFTEGQALCPLAGLGSRRCGPEPGFSSELALGLGIVGTVLVVGGSFTLIAGLARRPDEATRARRRELRDEIRQRRLELRVVPRGAGAMLELRGSFS